MKRPLALTDSDFEEEVFASEIPVLVDFWASWCPPCKMIEPVIQNMADDLRNTIKVAKVNVDQNPANASRYQITGVPTFIIFKDGRELSRRIGAQSKAQLLDMIKSSGIEI